jgi:hypothetical protein
MSSCLVHTCQTIKEFNYSNKILFEYKKKISNNKLQLYKSLSNYIEITNCSDLFLELKNNFSNHPNQNYCRINWNKIKIPENIKLVLDSRIKIGDFYPNKYCFNHNPKDKLNILNNIFNYYSQTIINIQPTPQILLLFEEITKEIISFKEANNTNQRKDDDIKNIQELTSIIFSCGDFFLLNSIDYKQYLFISEFVMSIIHPNYIISFPVYPKTFIQTNSENICNNYMLISDKQIYLKNNDFVINLKYLYDITNSENIGYGYIKDKFKKELLNIKVNGRNDIKKTYNYINRETQLKINSHSFYDNEKKLEYTKYNMNNCDFEELHNHNNNITHIISQCMISNDSTGIRYRGKYTGTSQDGKPIKKTIHIDDELKYLLEGDEVKVDLLDNKKRTNDEGIVVYKIAKSEHGDLRIVKLFIPPDAKIVRPIDSEYFITFGKERCDKAIVMDIQLPIKDEEQSVVPEEMTAYSYVHKINGSNNFEYKVGQEVYPDSFNPDENIGCANGLHFYQDRLTVFKAFIDNT